MISQIVYGVKIEMKQPLQPRLANGNKLCPQQLFSQQHAEHGRLLGVFQGNGGEMYPGTVGPGGKQHLIGGLPGTERHHQFLPVGLMELIHSAAQKLLFQLLPDMP